MESYFFPESSSPSGPCQGPGLPAVASQGNSGVAMMQSENAG